MLEIGLRAQKQEVLKGIVKSLRGLYRVISSNPLSWIPPKG
jgi:hypothetical protein